MNLELTMKQKLWQTFKKFSFKKIVKQKAHDLALSTLIAKKETHTKVKHLKHDKLYIQSYFTHRNLKVHELRQVFLFRVRMIDFWGNYRGNEKSRLCPVCKCHPDKQELMIRCPKIKEIFKNGEQIVTNIDGRNVTEENARNLVNILDFRKRKIEDK